MSQTATATPGLDPERYFHNDHRAAAIAGLRALADWLERHPELPIDRYGEIRVGVFPPDREAQIAVTGVAVGAGPWEEHWLATWISLRRDFGGKVSYEVYARPTAADIAEREERIRREAIEETRS